VTEADLHAYADQRVTPERAAEIVAHLAEHPADAERVAAWCRQRESLRALFDPVLAEPVPERLLRVRSRPALVPALARLAAALALVAAGALAGWFARDLEMAKAGPTLTLAREATTAHRVYVVEVRHPVEVTAKEEAHLVAWMSKRLGHPMRLPTLAAEGFSLVGGRLLPSAGGPAALYMYENPQGQRLTLYVRTGDLGGPTAFRFVSEGKTQGFYWVDGPLGYALMGDLERESLLKLARLIHHQLNP
jgi:anti-sigma factor RsiW